MKRNTIIGLLIALGIVAMFMACVEEETPTKVPGPTVTPTAIPTTVPGPTVIPTITPTPETIEVVQTPTALPEPKYVPGDLIGTKDGSRNLLDAVINYDESRDEYEIAAIATNQDGTWGYFLSESTNWYSREYIEQFKPILVTHIDISTITTEDTTTRKLVWELIIDYSGTWSGSYGDLGTSKSVDGTGSETFTISDPEFIISAMFQKKDDSSRTMRVSISSPTSKIVESESTSAAYGVVSISHTI